MFGRSKKPAKKTKSPAPLYENQDNRTVKAQPAQIQQPAQRSWLSQLEGQFLISGQGVVMKVYIENFKRMNDLFGFEHCNELLITVKDYLEKKTNCAVFRNVGVEFIIILRNRSLKDAQETAEQIIERFEQSWIVEDKKIFLYRTDCPLCLSRLPHLGQRAVKMPGSCGTSGNGSGQQPGCGLR